MITAPRQTEVTDADRDYVRGLFPELEQIADRGLADAVVEIWAETWKASAWERIEDVPKNPETVHLRHTLVPHTRAVTVQGIAMAKAMEEFHGIPVNLDWVIAGCNLHDVSKLMEYEPRGDGFVKSEFGELVQHGMYGVHKAIEHGLPVELAHIISSHTTQSRLPPKSVESIIVHYADYADSDVLMQEAGRKLLLTAAR
jgi:putative nucleotidyltransferase with HDIG domain